MAEGERSFNRDDFESAKVQKKKSVKKEKETKKLSKKELKLLEIKRELEREGEGEGEEEMKNGRRRDSFDHNNGNMGRNKNGLVHGMYEGEGEDFRCSQGEHSLIDSDGDGEEEEEGCIDGGGLEMRTQWVAEVRTGNCREDGSSSSSSSNTNLNVSNASSSGNVGGMSIEGTKGQKRRIRKKLDENEVSPHVQVREHKRRILNRYAV